MKFFFSVFYVQLLLLLLFYSYQILLQFQQDCLLEGPLLKINLYVSIAFNELSLQQITMLKNTLNFHSGYIKTNLIITALYTYFLFYSYCENER